MNRGERRHAPATARNREPILEVLRRILPASGTVLELASGTGEHALFMARHLGHLQWQPSDPDPSARESIEAWRHSEPLDNLLPPIAIDAASDDWGIASAAAMVCINMIHISPWAATEGLMRGAERLLSPSAPLYLYGPYFIDGRPRAPSNEAFGDSLRARDPSWGVRDLSDVENVAQGRGFVLEEVVDMPANNFSVIFRRRSAVP